ncbi:MAG: hypothetical protein ACHQ06_03550 [Candidatus Dormibacteria bacterium]
MVSLTSAQATSGQTVTYTHVVTNVAPPASSFAGAAGGGDGWGVGLTNTQLFNVFHHNATLRVNCHNQSNASACWASFKTITDGSGNNFATSGQPGLYVDQPSGHLFVFATRIVAGVFTAGVVCIDTTQPVGNLNPFCGFSALSAVGDATEPGLSNVSDPVQVGSKWYAFNYANGAVSGTRDRLLCFDLATLAACASQPFAVTLGSGAVANSTFPEPSIAAFGTEIIVPSTQGGTNYLGCFDTTTDGICAGTWPATSGAVTGFGAPFPLMVATGNTTGFCLATGTDPCFTLAGATASTPAGLAAVVAPETAWNSPSFVFGPRVYVPEGNVNQVACFDYSTDATCASMPEHFNNLFFLYSVNPDPQRPTCIWVNADSGTAQIQNFDLFTGGVCGSGPVRVLASAAVAPGAPCAPGAWTTLQVTTPAPGAYTSASVQFLDGDGNTIPGTSNVNLDNTGAVDLSHMNLATNIGLPQFLITFTGAPGLSQVTTKLTWTGPYLQACVLPGTQVLGLVASPPVPAAGSAASGSVRGGLAAALVGFVILAIGTRRRERDPR